MTEKSQMLNKNQQPTHYPQQKLIAPSLMTQSLDPNNKISVESIFSKYIPEEGFTARYDREGEYIAIGCYNGMKILFSNKQNKIVSTIEDEKEVPITSVKWRPNVDNSKSKVLGVGNAEGTFEYWHVPTMKKLFSIEEKQNSIHCIDFSPTGEHFATAGKDRNIRIYDENTKSISTTFGAAEWNCSGHSNRIFSVKFIDENILVSGGWDSVIHQWDMRVGKSVKTVYGPHVSGDSIDYLNGELLIGNYAAKNQVQIWDYATMKQKQALTWTSIEDKDKVAYVYSSCFSHSLQKNNESVIIAGACGVNEVKLFHRSSDDGGKYKEGVRIHGLKNGCFSVDHSKTKEEFCFTTAHKGFYAYQYQRKN